jgi:hypothetical protein
MIKPLLWPKRVYLWFIIRVKLQKYLWNDKSALEFIKDINKSQLDLATLKIIADRQCTAERAEQCIVSRPKDIKDWCSRCLALDHLVHR